MNQGLSGGTISANTCGQPARPSMVNPIQTEILLTTVTVRMKALWPTICDVVNAAEMKVAEDDGMLRRNRAFDENEQMLEKVDAIVRQYDRKFVVQVEGNGMEVVPVLRRLTATIVRSCRIIASTRR